MSRWEKMRKFSIKWCGADKMNHSNVVAKNKKDSFLLAQTEKKYQQKMKWQLHLTPTHPDKKTLASTNMGQKFQYISQISPGGQKCKPPHFWTKMSWLTKRSSLYIACIGKIDVLQTDASQAIFQPPPFVKKEGSGESPSRYSL